MKKLLIILQRDNDRYDTYDITMPVQYDANAVHVLYNTLPY